MSRHDKVTISLAAKKGAAKVWDVLHTSAIVQDKTIPQTIYPVVANVPVISTGSARVNPGRTKKPTAESQSATW